MQYHVDYHVELSLIAIKLLQGPFNYTIWSTTGTWRYKCHSEKLWTRIGQGIVKLEMDEGNYTRLPLTESVKIRAGSTQVMPPCLLASLPYSALPCTSMTFHSLAPIAKACLFDPCTLQAFYIHTPDNDCGVGYRNRRVLDVNFSSCTLLVLALILRTPLSYRPCKALDDGQDFSRLKVMEV
jgi:hypothetical protein